MLLERGISPWDVSIQLGHEDGGKLVMETYGHPRADAARARLLAAWETTPLLPKAVDSAPESLPNDQEASVTDIKQQKAS
jgi:hypothetical protein